MVAQNADINALLAKLSKAKPLPKATETFTQPTQQLRTQIRDSVIENTRRAPSLQESLNAIAQGQQSSSNPALGVAAKIFGNPIVKTALAPVIAFDTGRRGVISGVREITDMLDNDPNTEASFSDFAKQTKDTSFGYGKAFPMDGWGGRIAGFVGDVLLDPLTYATLGSAVPASAVLRGATSVGARVSTRTALGAGTRTGVRAKILGQTKPIRILSPESRNNLAKVSGDQARRINLLDDAERQSLNLTKRSEQEIQVMEQLIAKYGKTRVPADIARDIGLPKAGIYWFGSRVRMPLSGPLGRGLELLGASTRTRITGQTTGMIGRFMDQITPEGVRSDAVNVKDMRRALITGKATPEEASTYLRILDDNRQRRVIENITKEEYNRRYNLEIANNPLIQKHKDVLHEIIENPQRLATALPDEIEAKNAVDAWFKSMADSVEEQMKLVDPGFVLARISNYFPHQQTEKAMNYVDNLRNPFAEQLRAYLHTDLADPSVAFSHRTLQKGKVFFGHVLTDDDVAKGVKRLNEIARTKGGIDFDFFETDALKVLAKYGDSYGSEISRAHFLRRQFDNGVLKMLQDKGIYDTEALKSLELAVREAFKEVTGSSKNVANIAKVLSQNLNEALDTFVTQQKKAVTAAGKSLRSKKVATKVAAKSLDDTKRAIEALIQGLQNSGIKNANERLQRFGISGLLSESVVDAPLENIIGQLDELSNYMSMFNKMLADGTRTLDDFKSELSVLAKFAKDLEKEAGDYSTRLSEFDSIHETLGEFVNGRYSQLVMDSAEEGGGEPLERVVGLLKSQSLRDRVGLNKKGGIPQKKISAVWGDAARAGDSRIDLLQKWLDPNNVVTAAALRRMTIERVRDIVSRSTVKTNSLTELREALTWMVVRDIDRSPSLLDSIVAAAGKQADAIQTVDGNSLAGLVNDSGTVARITNIKETINKITKLDQTLNNVAREEGTDKVYGAAQIVDIQTQIQQLDDEIINKISQLALDEGSSGILPLRVWQEMSTNKPNEIVSDARAIEDLFNNLRSTTRIVTVKRFTEEVDVATGQLIPTEGADETIDLAETTIDALKGNGIENQELTYSQVEEALKTHFDILAESDSYTGANLFAKKEILDLQKRKQELVKKANTNAAKVRADVRTEIASMLDSSTYAETVMEYSNQALEYYIYSETKSQFNNLADELAPWGIKPSYGVYQRLLGDIAHSHVVKVQIFQEQLNDAENILRQIQLEVLSQPGSQQGIFLRGKLMQALDNETDGPVLDAVFPEIRAAVPRVKLADLSRLQANDEIMQGYRQQILVELRNVDTASGQARVSQRAGYLLGTGTSGRQAQAIPTAAGAGTRRGAQPGKQQSNINQLINELEGAPSNINMLTFLKRVHEVAKNRMSEKDYVYFNQKLRVIEDGVITRVEQLKKGLKETQESNKAAGLAAGRRTAGKQVVGQKKLARINYNLGLLGSLELAMGASTTKKIRDFFGNLYGGTVNNLSSGVKYTGIAKTARQEANQNVAFRVIKSEGSLIGTMRAKLYERAAALRATTELDYPIETVAATGSVLPTLTGQVRDGQTIFGVKAYAELLRERAQEIEATLLGNKEFAERIRQLRQQVDLNSSVPVERQLFEAIRDQEKVVKGTTIFRISPQTDISTLPKGIQAKVIEARKLKIAAAKIMETDEYLAANHEKTLNSVLHQLANIDIYRIVNTQGQNGLWYEASGLSPMRTWNAPRPGFGNSSNLDTLAVQRYLGTRTERDAGKFTVHAIEEVTFKPEKAQWDNADYVYLLQTRYGFQRVTKSMASQLDENELRAIREIRLTRAPKFVQTKEKKFLDFESQILGNSEYDPQKTWVRLPAQSAVQGMDRTASYGMITKEALPEVWVPVNEIVDTKSSQFPILETNFTPDEWEALFVPGPITKKGKLQALTTQRDKNDAARLRFAEMSRASGLSRAARQQLLAKFEKADKAFESAKRELALYKARTGARVKLNRLVERFSDPEVARALGVNKNKIQKAEELLLRRRQELTELTTRFNEPTKQLGSRRNADGTLTSFGMGTPAVRPDVSEIAKAEKAVEEASKNLKAILQKPVNPTDVAKAYVERQLSGIGDTGIPVVPESPKIVSRRQATIQTEFKTTPHAKVLKELDDIQKEMNNMAFTQYSDNLEMQYGHYLDVLDELQVTTRDWTKAQATVDSAKTLTNILDNPKVRAVVPEQQALPDTQIADSTEEEIQRLLNTGDAKSEEEALALIDAHNANLKTSADVAKDVANQLEQAPPQTALEPTDSQLQIRAGLQQTVDTDIRLGQEVAKQIEDLQFDQLLKTKAVGEIQKVINGMTARQRELLAAKAKRMGELALVDKKRLDLINVALRRAKVGTKGQDPVARLVELSEAHNLQIASFDQAKNLERLAETALEDAKARLDLIQEVAAKFKQFRNPNSKDLDWIPEFEAWRDEAVQLIELLSRNNNVSVKTQRILTSWMDGVNALELSKASLRTAESDLAAEKGIKLMFDQTGVGANMLIKQLEQGYEYLNKDALPNVMVKQAYAEILRNANSFRDPLAGATLNRVLKRWNSYWKPLATSTPGFHVRNNVGNMMAMVFGGVQIRNLPEAFEISRKWMQSTRDNVSWDDFVRTLTPEQQEFANTARWSVAATGGGVYTDVQLADNFVQRSKYVSFNKKLGYNADAFARFMFSYDAAMQGFSPEQAAMRTKRFYVDYEDVSSLDKTMRQIVPFWMWTSRNVVTQVQNMWTNPKPYQVYNSFVRNFRDKDDDNAAPKSWRDLQAFKLPFGKDLYAMPDLGFTRIQQQLETAKTPQKFLSDISPLVRVPVELVSGKQFYNNKEFKDAPTQVEGMGVARGLQPLAQMLGLGETNAQGQKFINEKLLYALTAMIPPASIADRLMPSTGASAGEFSMNTLQGFLGSPVKQLTPQLEKNELLRRLFEIQDVASRTNAVNNPQG